MSGGVEKESPSKAGFLQKFTQRFRPSEKQRRETEEDETRRLLAQYTSEPLEVVEERLRQRHSPEIRRLLAAKLMELKEAVDSGETLLSFYKTSVELGSVMLFGEKHQEIDLNSPLILSDKDSQLVNKLRPVVQSLKEGNKYSALEALKEIPEPLGSKCDRGEFDGYNHEALLTTTFSAVILRNMVPAIKKERQWNTVTNGLSTMIRGFDARNRLTVAKGFTTFVPHT